MRSTFFILLVLFPIAVQAAELHVRASPTSDGAWYEFLLDSQGSSINAIEGNIRVSGVREVRHGNSIVTLWLDVPTDNDGTIRFTGITPGGFSGSDGALFSVRADDVRPTLVTATAYLNDGSGTAVGLKIAPIETKNAAIDDADTVPPQEFVPVVGSDASIEGGKYFVSFLAQDKETGVVRYEIAETRVPLLRRVRDGTWKAVAHPHVLADQSLRSFIYVRAIDAAGNERMARLLPTRGIFSHGLLPTGIALGIVIAGILLLFTYARIVWHRR